MIMGHLHIPWWTTGSLSTLSTHINIQLDVSNHSPSAGAVQIQMWADFPLWWCPILLMMDIWGYFETNNPGLSSSLSFDSYCGSSLLPSSIISIQAASHQGVPLKVIAVFMDWSYNSSLNTLIIKIEINVKLIMISRSSKINFAFSPLLLLVWPNMVCGRKCIFQDLI